MASTAIDYDLHGIAGVRLVGARSPDAAVVDRQLGGLRAPLRRDPDVLVRFVDHLEVPRPVRLLGAGEAAFTDDAFLLLRSRHKARARVRVDVERLGAGGEIVVERGAPAVPLLVAIVNLAALANGALALHASAFAYRGLGIVATGWSKGGKTEALLAFMQRGARFVGDEWVYIAPEGDRVHGLPEPIRLWDWHLRQLPAVRGRVARRDRVLLGPLRVAAGTAGRRAPARRLAALLERQLHVDAAPSRLFDPEAIALSAGFDRLFLMRSWEDPDVRVAAIGGDEIAARMAFSLRHERAPLVACYEQFRFAFPDRVNPLIEQAPERERALLDRFLGSRAAHAVDHPYPVRFDALFEAMSARC
jgi:hypothetical protein